MFLVPKVLGVGIGPARGGGAWWGDPCSFSQFPLDSALSPTQRLPSSPYLALLFMGQLLLTFCFLILLLIITVKTNKFCFPIPLLVIIVKNNNNAVIQQICIMCLLCTRCHCRRLRYTVN